MTWTKPYYGVSHLVDCPKSHQVTMTSFTAFTEVCVISLHSDTPFTGAREELFIGDDATKKAQAWGEEQARTL